MTVQPPGHGEAVPPPPPVADRRAPERRSYRRRADDRVQVTRTAIVAATSICGGLAILFVFFWLLGAIDVQDAAAAAVAAIVLAAVWMAGFVYRHRVESHQARVHERERRGF
jgi:Na+-driven multidrug efflux pump